MRIKTLKIIPDNREQFLGALDRLPMSDRKKGWFESCLDVDVTYVDGCDDFYIDRPYKFNLYGYSQKFDARRILEARRLGWSMDDYEVNPFNYDPQLVKDNKYLKLKNKVGYDDYYSYVKRKMPFFEEQGDFLVVDKSTHWTLDGLVFDVKVMEQFVDYLIELYHKGLWLNNFNNYSIRYNGQFSCYDPDIFYVIEHNEDLCDNMETEKEFLERYVHYKLREKNIVYRIADPYYINLDLMEYIYYSYWFLENVSHTARKRL